MSDGFNESWVEPSEEARVLAQVVRGQYLALVTVGFDEEQALKLIGFMFARTSK